MKQFATVFLIGLVTVSARGECSTLPIVSGEADSLAVRYDARTTHSSKLVRGTVTIGEVDGGETMAWDTSALSDGWNKVSYGGSENELLVLNNPSVAIEGGRLAGNVEWSAEKTHLIRNTVYVPNGCTLTVLQGTVVKFCADTGIKIEDGGTLNIVGAEGADVIFTAANDDTVGERIVGMTSETISHKGVWKQSTGATFTDNNFVQMRGMSFGDYSAVSLNDSTAVRSSGVALVPVTLGGANRSKPFSISWAARDGSAKFGEDYTLAAGRVTWNKYDEGTKTISIPLVKDHVVGSNTMFTIEIVTNRAVNVGQRICTVTIKEWDTIDFQVATIESPTVRLDVRTSTSGRIVHGVEKITGGGNDDETAVENWNTATLEDGWVTLTRSTNSLDVLAVNAKSIAVEGGRIAANTTWTSEKTHLVRNTVYIPSGKTLTVTTNAVVKFMDGTGIKIEDGGKLNVVGSSDGDVIFTAANDDTAGIVISGLGEEPIAHDGFWKQSSAATFTDNGCIQTRNWGTGIYPEVWLNDITSFRPDGMAYVSVTISGTRDQPLNIEWRTIDGTAKYGEDFTVNAGRVSWNKASEGTKTIQIPLVKEHIVGKTTSFGLEITVNRGVNVSRRTCTVEIRERDTLNLEAAEAASSPVRYDCRKVFPGLLNTGVVMLGSPDGKTATAWDTRLEDNGWVTVASGETNADLAVINDMAISIEGGRLTDNTTWTSNATHLVRNTVYVPNGVTLTLSEGTVVKYLEGTTIKIEDGGKLNVVGGVGNDVVLTAANDDTVGAEIPAVDKTKTISFSGITKMSSGTYTDNTYVQTRGFIYGSYPTLTLHDAVVNRMNGKVYIPVTVGGTTRNQPFNADWEVVPDTATFGSDFTTRSGTLSWSKSGEGTKHIEIALNDSLLLGERLRFKVKFAAVRGASVADGEAEVTIHEYTDCGIKTDVSLAESSASADFAVRESIREQPIFLNESEPIAFSGKWQTFDASEAAKLRVSIESDNGVKVLKEAGVDETGEFAFRPEDYPVGHYTLKHEIVDKVGDPLATMSKTFSIVDSENVVLHGGTLTSNETWTAGMVHVVYESVFVPAASTLFIEPGAIVKFLTGTGIDLQNGAALFANAIVFTHINDDTVGGDTLSDGYTVAPPMDAYFLTGNFTFGDDAELRNITQKTALSGTLNGTKMLSKGSTYRVSGTYTIANGASLTIPAGTILKMENNAAIVVNSGGTLTANGTRAAPIVFTSINDDSYGGATQGSNHNPQPGDWSKIGIAGGRAYFDHVQVLYSSRNSTTGAINMNGGSVSFSNGVISHGKYDAVGVESGNFFMTNSVISDCLLAFRHWARDPIVNCIVYDCGRLTQGGGQHFVNCVFSRISETWEAFGFPQNGTTYDHCVFWNEGGSVLTAEGTQDALTVCGKNGNIWGNPLFIDPEHGDFRIVEGSPCVDAADSSVAPELDFYGQPRVTLAEQTKDTPVVQGQLADIGICEVMPRDVTSDIDLQPVSVRAEEKATPGQLLFVKWTVSNAGGVEVEGSWRDTVSFVSENGQEVTLGEKITTSHIAVGGEVFCSAYFTVPALAEGMWRLKVNVNSYHDIFEGSLFANNALTSDRTVEISLPSIDPAQGATDGVINAGVPKVLKLTFAEGEENRMVHLDLPAGVKVAYGFGFMPRGANASGTITAGDNGALFRVPEGMTDVYVTLESDTTAQYALSFENSKVEITSVSPNTLPSSGQVTVTITGAGFTFEDDVSLIVGSQEIPILSEQVVDANCIKFCVDCASLVAGRIYGIRIGHEVFDDCLMVMKASGTGVLWYEMILPEVSREGRIVTGHVNYGNSGTADLEARIVDIVSVADGKISRDGRNWGDTLRFLAGGPIGRETLLAPGETSSFDFYILVGEENSFSVYTDYGKDVAAEGWMSAKAFRSDLSQAVIRHADAGLGLDDYASVLQTAERIRDGDNDNGICGRVLSHCGDILTDVSVRITGLDAEGRTNSIVVSTSDAFGRFGALDLPDGDYVIEVGSFISASIRLTGGQYVTHDICLDLSNRITAVVGDGFEEGDRRLVLRAIDGTRTYGSAGHDGTGLVVFDSGIPNGFYRLVCLRSDEEIAGVDVYIGEDRSQSLRLMAEDGCCSVSGIVENLANYILLPGTPAVVRLSGNTAFNTYEVLVSADNPSFELTGVVADTYEVEVAGVTCSYVLENGVVEVGSENSLRIVPLPISSQVEIKGDDSWADCMLLLSRVDGPVVGAALRTGRTAVLERVADGDWNYLVIREDGSIIVDGTISVSGEMRSFSLSGGAGRLMARSARLMDVSDWLSDIFTSCTHWLGEFLADIIPDGFMDLFETKEWKKADAAYKDAFYYFMSNQKIRDPGPCCCGYNQQKHPHDLAAIERFRSELLSFANYYKGCSRMKAIASSCLAVATWADAAAKKVIESITGSAAKKLIKKFDFAWKLSNLKVRYKALLAAGVGTVDATLAYKEFEKVLNTFESDFEMALETFSASGDWLQFVSSMTRLSEYISQWIVDKRNYYSSSNHEMATFLNDVGKLIDNIATAVDLMQKSYQAAEDIVDAADHLKQFEKRYQDFLNEYDYFYRVSDMFDHYHEGTECQPEKWPNPEYTPPYDGPYVYPRTVKSVDPNEMVGPMGAGDPETERFVKPGEWMTYTVYFENKSDATAAAQEVYVSNPLSEYLDWSTFEMGEVAFNNQIDLGLSGKKNGTSEVTMNGTNYAVRTELKLDEKTGVADWYMRIVDPSTETGWPEDVLAGFLPPNDETFRGEGHITYRVKVREDAPADARIDNSATIVFDYNPPIETDPAWWNTVSTLTEEISGRYVKLDLVDDLGLEIPSDVDYAAGDKVTVKVEGLPKGLKVVATPVYEDPDAKKKVIKDYIYTIEGVPTEEIDFETRPMYARVTVTYKDKTKGDKGKVESLQPSELSIVTPEPSVLTAGVLNQVYGPADIAELWPEVAKAKDNPKEWSFKGWPAGLKYNATAKDASWSYKKDGTTVKTTTAPYTVYGQPTKAGEYPITATWKHKLADGKTSVSETFSAVLTVWGDDGTSSFRYTNQAYGAAVNETLADAKSVSGLPTGLKFKAGQVTGTPTKPGVFAVTVTQTDNTKKTFLWKIDPPDAPEFALVTGTAPVEDRKAQIVQGANQAFAIATSDIAAKVTVTGLPTGLKLVATPVKDGAKTIGNTYSVEGVASKPGEYFVTFKTVLNGVTTVTTMAFTVRDNPIAATYLGAVEANPAAGVKLLRYAVAEVSVAAAGTVKLTYTEGKTKYTASVKSFDWDDVTGKGTVEGLVLKVSSADKTLGYGDRKATVTFEDRGAYLKAKLSIADANGTGLSSGAPPLFETVKTTEVPLPASQTFVFRAVDGGPLATVSVAYDAKKATAAFSGKLYDGTAVKATVPVTRWGDDGDSGDYVFAPFLVIAKDGTVYCFDNFSSGSGFVDVVDETGEQPNNVCADSVDYTLGDAKFAELVPETGAFTFGWGSDAEVVGASTESFAFEVTTDKNGNPAGVAIYDAEPQEGEKPLATVTAKMGKATGAISVSFTSKKGDKAKYTVELVWRGDKLFAGHVTRTWKGLDQKTGKPVNLATYGMAEVK